MELTLISEHEVYLDGKELDIVPSQKRHNHSPTGFNWGYGGSGPAQLSLAIMLEMLKGTEYAPDYEPEVTQRTVYRHYQDFKREVIAKLPQKQCTLEFDFWGWFHGNPNPRFEVHIIGDLEKNEERTYDAIGTCTYPERCQQAECPDCDCACGGVNHGIQRRLFN